MARIPRARASHLSNQKKTNLKRISPNNSSPLLLYPRVKLHIVLIRGIDSSLNNYLNRIRSVTVSSFSNSYRHSNNSCRPSLRTSSNKCIHSRGRACSRAIRIERRLWISWRRSITNYLHYSNSRTTCRISRKLILSLIPSIPSRANRSSLKWVNSSSSYFSKTPTPISRLPICLRNNRIKVWTTWWEAIWNLLTSSRSRRDPPQRRRHSNRASHNSLSNSSRQLNSSRRNRAGQTKRAYLK